MNNPEIWTIKMADHPQDDFVRLSAYKALDLQMAELMVENARLKAEVEAHEKRWAESEDLISHYKQQRDEAYNDCQCHRLKAEVELLRKAGDAMAVMVGHIEITGDAHRMMLELSKDWNAAKEGKQS